MSTASFTLLVRLVLLLSLSCCSAFGFGPLSLAHLEGATAPPSPLSSTGAVAAWKVSNVRLR